ncbi:MAG: hypothetical protein ACTTJ7_09165 [Treponema sp.]
MEKLVTISQYIDNTMTNVSGDTEGIQEIISAVTDSRIKNKNLVLTIIKYLERLSL